MLAFVEEQKHRCSPVRTDRANDNIVLHMQLCALTDVPAIAAALAETVQVDALPRSQVLSTRREPACNHNIRVAMVVSCAFRRRVCPRRAGPKTERRRAPIRGT